MGAQHDEAFTVGEVLTIGNGELELGVIPRHGGSWTSLRVRRGYGWADILRPAAAPALRAADRLGFANWPLVPYSNRIANGELNCVPGRRVRLPANAPAVSPHAIHGHGWLRSWNLVAHTVESVHMVLEPQAGVMWPWRHRIEATVAVSGTQVESWLSVTNLDRHPMPAGIGWHTYFPRTPDSTITARLGGVWLASPDGIPTNLEVIPTDMELRTGARLIDLPAGDNCYSGWDGVACLTWPENQLTVELTADPAIFGHAVFYNPPGVDFYCFEPVSHSTNALNLPPDTARSEGVHLLDSGQTLSGNFKLRVL